VLVCALFGSRGFGVVLAIVALLRRYTVLPAQD